MQSELIEQNKCGEIFYNKNGKLIILCYFCKKCLNNYTQYENHINSKHHEEIHRSTVQPGGWIKQEHFLSDFTIDEEGGVEELRPQSASPSPSLENEQNIQIVQLKIEIDEKAVEDNQVKFQKYTGEVLLQYKNEIDEDEDAKQLYECDTGKISNSDEIVTLRKRLKPQNQCNYCDKMFSHRQQVYTHNTTFRYERSRCTICDQRLCGAKQYQEHQLTAHNLLVPSPLPNWKRISINKINENDNSTVTCTTVSKKTKSPTVKYFECDICKKIIDTYCNIVRHMRKHSGEKPFQCELCSMKFVQKSSLQLHVRNVHTHERPYQCTECGKRFPFVRILNTHIRRIHRKHERIYRPCPICGKMFSSSDKIKLHLTTHSTERPFSCTKCEKRFKNIPTLRQHKTIHSESKLFPCPYCDVNFAQWSGRSAHIKRVHSIS